jgi:hypothetical protein
MEIFPAALIALPAFVLSSIYIHKSHEYFKRKDWKHAFLYFIMGGMCYMFALSIIASYMSVICLDK